jgi:hypothetical protein
MVNDNWMRKAMEMRAKGSLHRMTGVPFSKDLPITFLQAIVDTPIEEIAFNHTKTGFPHVRVTHLMKKEAVAKLNAIRASRKARASKKSKK